MATIRDAIKEILTEVPDAKQHEISQYLSRRNGGKPEDYLAAINAVSNEINGRNTKPTIPRAQPKADMSYLGAIGSRNAVDESSNAIDNATGETYAKSIQPKAKPRKNGRVAELSKKLSDATNNNPSNTPMLDAVLKPMPLAREEKSTRAARSAGLAIKQVPTDEANSEEPLPGYGKVLAAIGQGLALGGAALTGAVLDEETGAQLSDPESVVGRTFARGNLRGWTGVDKPEFGGDEAGVDVWSNAQIIPQIASGAVVERAAVSALSKVPGVAKALGAGAKAVKAANAIKNPAARNIVKGTIAAGRGVIDNALWTSPGALIDPEQWAKNQVDPVNLAMGAGAGALFHGVLPALANRMPDNAQPTSDVGKAAIAHAEARLVSEGYLAPPAETVTEPLPVKPAEPTPASWKKPESIVEMPTEQIMSDPERLQYKLDTDAKGVGKELKSVKKFDKELAGVLLVWRDPADGKTYVVNGHHRLELAQRTGEPTMAVRYIEAATPELARAKGARANIAEGRGTAIDAAKFLRDTGYTPQVLADMGISLRGKIASQGIELSNLSDALFNRVVQQKMTIERGAIIGRELPGIADQTALMAAMDKVEAKGKEITDSHLAEIIRHAKAAPEANVTETNLFGEEVFTKTLLAEKAEVSDYIRKQLASDKQLYQGKVSNEKSAEKLADAGNVINVEENQKRLTEAQKVIAHYDSQSVYKGPISDILNEAAQRLAQGEKANIVKEETYGRIRQALSKTDAGGNGRNGIGDQGTGIVGDDPARGGRSGAEPGTVTSESVGSVKQELGADAESFLSLSKTKFNLSDADISIIRENANQLIKNGESPLAAVAMASKDYKPTAITANDKQTSIPVDDSKTSFTKIGNPAKKLSDSTIKPTSPQKAVEGGLFGESQGSMFDAPGSTSGNASGGGYKRPETSPTLTIKKPSATIDITTDASRLEMPELVKMFEDLSGEIPSVLEQLRLSHGTARGAFYGDPVSPRIQLKADIFLGDPLIKLRESQIPSFLTDGQANMQSGKSSRTENIRTIREKIAEKTGFEIDDIVVRYGRDKKTGKDIYTAYHVNPDLAPQVMAHEVGHFVDWYKGKTLTRGNILGHLSGFKSYLKHTIDAEPLSSTFKLTGKERIQKAQVTAELKRLTQKWKPFDDTLDPKFTKYRYSPKELYADMVSVLFNEPALFEREAPIAHDMFMNYLQNKPEFRAEYQKLQDLTRDPQALFEARKSDLHEMWDEGSKAREDAINRKGSVEKFSDTLMRAFVDEAQPALKGIRKRIKAGGTATERALDAKHGIEETQYIDARASVYVDEINSKLLDQMTKEGVAYADINDYMFHKRILADRKHLANPKGHNPKTSADFLRDMKSDLGAEKFAAVEKIVNDYRDLRETLFPEVRKSGLHPDETMDMIEESNRNDYARFAIYKHLEEQFGGQTAAAIHPQIGTLHGAESPLVATILQDISMIRAAKLNSVKAELLTDLLNGGDIKPAKMRWSLDIKGRVPVEPKNPELGLFTVMVKGKPQHYYIDKMIVDMFKYEPVKAMAVKDVWNTINGIQRDVLVSKNPAWMARNVFRDFAGTTKNLHYLPMKDIPKLAKAYVSAYKEVYKEVAKGERSDDLKAAMTEYAIPSGRIYSGQDVTYDNTLERLVHEVVIKSLPSENVSGVKKAFQQLGDVLDKVGRISETGGKLAGYKYIKENHPEISVRQRAHDVRNLVGTPNWKARGSQHALTNNIFLFSNVNVQGLRAARESYQANPTRYMWKTIALNVIPKLITIAAGTYGANALVGKSINKMDEYDKRTYTTVPLGLINDGQDAIYLRLPQDYEGQAIGTAVYDALQGKIAGKDGAISTLAAQNPLKLHPLLATGIKLYEYGVMGINPVDEYRGRNVMPDQVFKAGGLDAAKAMGSYAWNNIGGSTIYKAKSGPEIITDESTLQKALRLPGLNAFGSFVRISHNGETSEIYDVIDNYQQDEAKKGLDRKAAKYRLANKGVPVEDAYNQLVKDGYVNSDTTSLNEFSRDYEALNTKKNGSSWMSNIAKKQPNGQRKALLMKFKEGHTADEYKKLVNELAESGTIPLETLSEISGVELSAAPISRSTGGRSGSRLPERSKRSSTRR